MQIYKYVVFKNMIIIRKNKKFSAQLRFVFMHSGLPFSELKFTIFAA